MAGRKRRVNNKARTKDVSAGADEDLDEDLDEAAEGDPDVILSDDAEDMETDGSDTLELPAISDISGSAATAKTPSASKTVGIPTAWIRSRTNRPVDGSRPSPGPKASAEHRLANSVAMMVLPVPA